MGGPGQKGVYGVKGKIRSKFVSSKPEVGRLPPSRKTADCADTAESADSAESVPSLPSTTDSTESAHCPAPCVLQFEV